MGWGGVGVGNRPRTCLPTPSHVVVVCSEALWLSGRGSQPSRVLAFVTGRVLSLTLPVLSTTKHDHGLGLMDGVWIPAALLTVSLLLLCVPHFFSVCVCARARALVSPSVKSGSYTDLSEGE